MTPMRYRVWWRCFWHALRDTEHGQNPLAALEHATGAWGTPRARLCRRALRAKMSQPPAMTVGD